MDLILKKNPDELVQEFFSLKAPKDVAELLEVSYKVLNYHLYIANINKQYTTFSIPKRSGGSREIRAPITALKIMQQKLNLVLQHVYRRKPWVHGFVYRGNILTNAEQHIGRDYVLNVDLLDFFPSINFGRVYGMFKNKPYNRPDKVAAVLARICCFKDQSKDQLPQGAPTSPIISNMICGKMDDELMRLSRKNHCRYTRYADDMTFSTDCPDDFPEAIAVVKDSAGAKPIRAKVGAELSRVIERNGFLINTNKVWLQHKYWGQQVTGLIVNDFPNVKRRYRNQIRAMLHAWEKYGLENAEREFIEKYDIKKRWIFEKRTLFKEVVRGKIGFFKMVRGPQNPTYLNFCEQLAKLDPDFAHFFEHIIKKEARKDTFEDAIFILESQEVQGTAFMLKDVGLVTCAHVLGNQLFAFKEKKPEKHYKVKVLCKCNEKDIAILDIEGKFEHSELQQGESNKMRRGDSVKLLGFPNYGFGQGLQIYPGVIVGRRRPFGQGRINISARIICGNSGGPVINDKNEVIGVAVTGDDKIETFTNCEYGVIPIETIERITQ